MSNNFVSSVALKASIFVSFIGVQVSNAQQIGSSPIYYNGTNVGISTSNPTSKLDVDLGTQSTVKIGLSVYRGGDPNYGIRLVTGVGDGADYSVWNGGLGSWYGIGFHSILDGVTRGVFNTRDGSFSMKGNLVADGNATLNGGSLQMGHGNDVSIINGYGFCGAIQFKSNISTGGYDARYLRLGVRDNAGVFSPVISITDQLYAGIGTTNPDSKLTVKGKIHAEEVKVDLAVPGPDYVFNADYDLSSLKETAEYITLNKHLPGVPSAKDMQLNGIELGEMNMLLLKKVEELTLHLIEQSEALKSQVDIIRSQGEALKALQEKLK